MHSIRVVLVVTIAIYDRYHTHVEQVDLEFSGFDIHDERSVEGSEISRQARFTSRIVDALSQRSTTPFARYGFAMLTYLTAFDDVGEVLSHIQGFLSSKRQPPVQISKPTSHIHNLNYQRARNTSLLNPRIEPLASACRILP